MKFWYKTKRTFDRIMPAPYREAAKFTLINLLGSLVPLWGGALILLLLSNWQGFGVFYGNGEFYIYTAALITPAFYTIYSYRKSKSYILFAGSIICLIVAALFFAVILTTQAISIGNFKVNVDVVKISSFVLFFFAVLISFAAQVIVAKGVDINAEARNDVEKLRKGMKMLR